MSEELDRIKRAIAQTSAPSSDFDLNPGFLLPENRKLRDAAVLIPLIKRAGGINVILTKRASHLKHHPGQIAFPGGKVEAGDDGVLGAALREANEEIGLPPDTVRPIGRLATHETVTSFTIYPVIAEVMQDFTPKPEMGEVAEVFEVPLDHVTKTANFSIQYRMWQGQKRQYYTVPYGPYYIWGATARILRGLADRVSP